jgi:hypothetical protein
VWTQIRRAHVLFWTGLALLLALLPAGASAIQPADAAYRGDAHMGRRTATATFRVVHSHVVDFQLSGLDLQDMLVRHSGRFNGCTTREAAHPCVEGRFTARDRARGTVAFGKHGLWRFSARAIGTQR